MRRGLVLEPILEATDAVALGLEDRGARVGGGVTVSSRPTAPFRVAAQKGGAPNAPWSEIGRGRAPHRRNSSVSQSLVRVAGGAAVPRGTVAARRKSAYFSASDSFGVT